MSHGVAIGPVFRNQRFWATSQRQLKSGANLCRVNSGRCFQSSARESDGKNRSERRSILAIFPSGRNSNLRSPRQVRGALVCEAGLQGVSRSGKNEKERLDGEAQIAEMLEAGNKAAMEGIGYNTDTESRPLSLT